MMALLDFFLARYAVLGPGYGFEAFLLQLFLTDPAIPIFLFLDALERFINQGQDSPVGVSLTEE